MTVIAWDGKTLAADRRSNSSWGVHDTVTKISRHNGQLLAVAGKGDVALEMKAWWMAGAGLAQFPASARTDDGGNLIVITDDRRVLQFGVGPIPIEMQGRFYVVGCGGDIALAAMHCGRTAAEAVALACELNGNCGNGIDTLELLPPEPRPKPAKVNGAPGWLVTAQWEKPGLVRRIANESEDPFYVFETFDFGRAGGVRVDYDDPRVVR
jgi:hypothetical protein